MNDINTQIPIQETHHLKGKPFLLFLLFVLALIMGTTLYVLLQRNSQPKISSALQSVSFCPKLLLLPGVIDEIDSKYIYLKQLTNQESKPQDKTKESIILKGKITPTTAVKQSPIFISYLLKKPAYEIPEQLNFSDLRVGMSVALSTYTDFCLLKKPEFDIYHININQQGSSIQGRISEIRDHTIILYGIHTPTNKEVRYEINVTADTEISYRPKNSTNVEKLGLSDLTINSQIIVYTNADTGARQKLTAYRIEPLSFPTRIQLSPTPSYKK